MAWPEYAVPLTLHDLPAKETYKHIINSLKALEDASNGVFTRIEKAAQSRRDRLDELRDQMRRIEGKIGALEGSTHPLTVEAAALYPEMDELRSWVPLFREQHPAGLASKGQTPSGISLEGRKQPEGGRMCGQDTAELFHFFKQAQAYAGSVSDEAGPVSIPETLSAATALLQYNTRLPAFRTAAEDAAAERAAASSSALTLHKRPASHPKPDSNAASESVQRSFPHGAMPAPKLPLLHTPPELAESLPGLSTDSSTERSSLKKLIIPGPAQSPTAMPPATAQAAGAESVSTPAAGHDASEGSRHTRDASGRADSQETRQEPGGHGDADTGSAEVSDRVGSVGDAAIQALKESLAKGGISSGAKHSSRGSREHRSRREPSASARAGTAQDQQGSSRSRQSAHGSEAGSQRRRGTAEADLAETSRDSEHAQRRVSGPAAQSDRAEKQRSSSSRGSRQPSQGAQSPLREEERQKGRASAPDSRAPSTREGLPPRSQPGSASGSAESLDAQQPGAARPRQRSDRAAPAPGDGSFGAAPAAPRWPGAPVSPHVPQSPLEKQVDFGGLGLGDGSTDLEHSIMLRQRSLSSRTSLDDLAK